MIHSGGYKGRQCYSEMSNFNGQKYILKLHYKGTLKYRPMQAWLDTIEITKVNIFHKLVNSLCIRR